MKKAKVGGAKVITIQCDPDIHCNPVIESIVRDVLATGRNLTSWERALIENAVKDR